MGRRFFVPLPILPRQQTYKAYADHVTNSYFSIKNKILVMFERSNRREMPDPADSPSQPPVAEQAAK
jgi:hypothetical protein